VQAVDIDMKISFDLSYVRYSMCSLFRKRCWRLVWW